MQKIITLIISLSMLGLINLIISKHLNTTKMRKEQSLVYDIVKKIQTEERNVLVLGSIQSMIDKIDVQTQLLSYLNCFYSVNCNLTNEFVANKTEEYNRYIENEVSKNDFQTKGFIMLAIVNLTLLISRISKHKRETKENQQTLCSISELRTKIFKPILTDIDLDNVVLISPKLINRINNIDCISRVIFTKDGEIVLHTDKELNLPWLIKMDKNKYYIKLNGLPKKVA